MNLMEDKLNSSYGDTNMTKRVHLGQYLTGCPKYWIKFIKNLNNPDTLDTVLESEYRARLNRTTWDLEFDKESDYVMFLLQWGTK